MYYAAIERFDRGNGERWLNYTRWLGRTDLERVITLDSTICPPLVHVESGSDWEFVSKEEFMLDFFTDLNFVLRRAAGLEPELERAMVIAVAREPSAEEVASFAQPSFEFAGFDIVDPQFTASAVLNWSRFPGVLEVWELARESGLIRLRERAFEICDALRRRYPKSDLAEGRVWAVWHHTGELLNTS